MRAPTLPPWLEIERCGSCGAWTFTGRPCASCDPVAREGMNSHEWRDLDGTPVCERCSVKVWHLDALLYCPEWVEEALAP